MSSLIAGHIALRLREGSNGGNAAEDVVLILAGVFKRSVGVNSLHRARAENPAVSPETRIAFNGDVVVVALSRHRVTDEFQDGVGVLACGNSCDVAKVNSCLGTLEIDLPILARDRPAPCLDYFVFFQSSSPLALRIGLVSVITRASLPVSVHGQSVRVI